MTKRNFLVLLLSLAWLLAACGPVGPRTEPPTPDATADPQEELTRNRQKWQAAGIRDYRFGLFIGCFCPFVEEMPLTIEVRDGQAISILDKDGNPARSEYIDFYLPYATIDGLFAALETDLNGGADKVTVKYDAQYGFPTEAYIDQFERAVDDEMARQITYFEALNP